MQCRLLQPFQVTEPCSHILVVAKCTLYSAGVCACVTNTVPSDRLLTDLRGKVPFYKGK